MANSSAICACEPEMLGDRPTCWHLPSASPFALAGFAWFAVDRRYRRLPLQPSHPLPEAVDGLANNTAGGQIRFQTDSTHIAVRVRLTNANNMDHMPSTGQNGFDCYVGPVGAQRYFTTSRMTQGNPEYTWTVFTAGEPTLRNFTLNFPLYQGVEEVLVGLTPDARILSPLPFRDSRPVVVYGTSITQGGCACRPGMVYTNILSRRLNREFINLGFSGSGKGEPEVAHVIAGIPNPACLVLDYEANCVSTELFTTTLPEFIRILRDAHPSVPILVVSQIRFSYEAIDNTSRQTRLARRQMQIDTVDLLRKAGDNRVFFFDGGAMLGDDFDECTVDGVHATDLGFLRMANSLEPVLRALLHDY